MCILLLRVFYAGIATALDALDGLHCIALLGNEWWSRHHNNNTRSITLAEIIIKRELKKPHLHFTSQENS